MCAIVDKQVSYVSTDTSAFRLVLVKAKTVVHGYGLRGEPMTKSPNTDASLHFSHVQPTEADQAIATLVLSFAADPHLRWLSPMLGSTSTTSPTCCWPSQESHSRATRLGSSMAWSCRRDVAETLAMSLDSWALFPVHAAGRPVVPIGALVRESSVDPYLRDVDARSDSRTNAMSKSRVGGAGQQGRTVVAYRASTREIVAGALLRCRRSDRDRHRSGGCCSG